MKIRFESDDDLPLGKILSIPVCIIDASVCNNKQRWNKDKCTCEWREELSDKESHIRNIL